MAVAKKTDQILDACNRKGVSPGCKALITFSTKTGDITDVQNYGAVNGAIAVWPKKIKRNQMWVIISGGGWAKAKLST